MAPPPAKATNRCGTTIEVGHYYVLNKAPSEQACKEPSGTLQVKVVALRRLENGLTIARLSYPRDGKHNVHLEWTSIDRLYEPLRVSRRFGSPEHFTKNIG